MLHDQAITGVEPEGKLGVTYSEKTYTFHDGEEYSLLTPTYTISEWYADSIAAEDLIVDVRIPLRHVGMGQMMALDPTELEELARRSNYPEYGISGRLNYITERGKQYIGISGNKAQHADLTIELGFSSDLGVTNDRYPLEVAEGQSQMLGYSHYGIQISTHDMENVDFYLHTLGVPARRNVDDPIVQQGEQAFYRARCDLCHVPTLHTRADAPALIGGTRLPWLASETIHPYSDFLLHDMGPDLDSHYVSGLAQGCEWRTTPLWGIGLQQKVNQHTYFLHDGRARNLKEAIMWHGGEGAVSRELFARMVARGPRRADQVPRIIVKDNRTQRHEDQNHTITDPARGNGLGDGSGRETPPRGPVQRGGQIHRKRRDPDGRQERIQLRDAARAISCSSPTCCSRRPASSTGTTTSSSGWTIRTT